MRYMFVAICFMFLACSKPLVKQMEQNHSEARKETLKAVSVENTASFEAMKADSIVIVKYDTVTREKVSMKYYGIEKTKTDTVSLVNTVLQTKTDTVYSVEKVFEENEKGTMGSLETVLKLLLAIVVICAMIYFFRRK